MDPVPLPLGLFYVACGGALGSGGRFLLGQWVVSAGRPGWWGTLAVNVLGSFVMGALLASAPPRRTTLLLGTGVLGGFTTFSAMSADAAGLFGASGDWRGAAYLAASLTLGITAFYAGAACARVWAPAG